MPEIEDWIREQLDAGYTPEEVKQSLSDSVYDPNLVDKVLAERSNPSRESSNFFGRSKKIILAVVLVGIIGVSVYLLKPKLPGFGDMKRKINYTEIRNCTNITEAGAYKLINNISSGENTCIRIKRNNVVLEGNGKKIDGLQRDEYEPSFGVGIYNNKSNITVKNLKIAGYQWGVFLRNVKNIEIRRSTFSEDEKGIGTQYIKKYKEPLNKDITIEGNSFRGDKSFDYDTGVGLQYSSNVEIKNNDFFNYLYEGVSLDHSSNVEIKNNVFRKNGNSISTRKSSEIKIIENGVNSSQVGIGMKFTENSLIKDNTVFNNSYGGIILSYSSNNRLIENTVKLNEGNGISLHNSSENRLIDNKVKFNHRGIRLFEKSSGNKISNNLVKNNSYGVSLKDSSRKNEILDNRILKNDVGIYTYDLSWKNKIEGNRICQNKMDLYITTALNYGSNFCDKTDIWKDTNDITCKSCS